jgi:hypothetical protein
LKDNIYFLRSKISAIYFSKFACIYTLERVSIHENLDKSVALILERMEYLAVRYQIYEMIAQLSKCLLFQYMEDANHICKKVMQLVFIP